MSFNLRKPPVIECWIEFETEVGEAGAQWSPKATEAFLSTFSGNFSPTRLRWAPVIERNPDDERPTLSRYCDAVEGVNAAQNRVVQVGEKVLVYSALRDDKDWPSFSSVCDEAIAALGAYRSTINPGPLASVTLHYRDIVDLPNPQPDQGVNIEDYFKLHIQTPDIPKRRIAHYSIDLYFDPTDSEAGIYLETRPLPYDQERKVLPIQLMWHSLSTVSGTATDSEIADALQISNRSLLEVFRACFTDLGWALFEPE